MVPAWKLTHLTIPFFPAEGVENGRKLTIATTRASSKGDEKKESENGREKKKRKSTNDREEVGGS